MDAQAIYLLRSITTISLASCLPFYHITHSLEMAAKDQALFSANELRSLENTIAFYQFLVCILDTSSSKALCVKNHHYGHTE
jgi:hypothetical protein